MAPSDPHPPSASSSGDNDDSNPFVAFRRFADEQVSAMLQSVTGLPSILKDPSSANWAAYDEQVRRTLGDWTSWPGGPQPASATPNRSDAERSDTEPGTAEPSGPAPREGERPGADAPAGHAPWHPHLDRFLRADPYSPAQLERDGGALGRRVDWRAAFEDLLAAQGAHDMPARGRAPGPGDRRWTGDEWRRVMLALYGHGGGAAEEHGSGRGPATELDMYERLGLAGTGTGTGTGTRESGGSGASPAAAGPEREGVVSTVMTAEKVTLPDGTTTKRAVVKTRFADGHEESNETVQVMHGQTTKAESGDTETKKKGWFWS